MLQLSHISKSYTTNAFTQVALDDVSLAFRDNEFVSILGPSGSGKTTLLNVIGGLDHFDSGDLLIDGISTAKYRDRDWDAYRNNRIGFVFQSYNLIPHQTILANVELALTLSGVSAAERRERARQALVDVGLGEHVDKRPSQLSGGQMQRVAIARALINDPEILLADEPTGALDSHTSVQVMDLLRQVATDRLVIMVTHNPDLARQYSTRIVELADGCVRSDTDPFAPSVFDMRKAKPAVRTSMSFLTALSLSFNNLMTKKGRTLMTAFAGSIGIIGIAAILALANGVNAYIQEVEEDTLSVYPLQIMSSGFDMTSMFVDTQTDEGDEGEDEDDDDAGDRIGETALVNKMFSRVGKNDLASLKTYLDGNGGGINSYVQDIEYRYDIIPRIFDENTDDGVRQINPDTSFQSLGIGGSSSALMSSSSAFTTNVFDEMPANLSLIEDQFDVRAGRWPESYNELVLVLSRRGTISDFVSYAIGLRDHDVLERMVKRLADQEDVEAPEDERTYNVGELMGRRFVVVPASRFYSYESEYDVWTDKSDDEDYVRSLVREGLPVTIVGVVQPKEGVDATTITQGIYYTPKLTRWLMKEASSSRIVREQLRDRQTNVISGKSFDDEADDDDGESFDMGKLFTVDEGKMAEAFAIDPDNLDLSGLDFSDMGDALDFSSMGEGMDFSSMEMPQMDLSQLSEAMGDMGKIDLDLSGIDLSKLDLSDIDLSKVDLKLLSSPEVTAALMPDLSTIDLAKLLEGITPVVDQDKLAPVISELQQGLLAYITEQGVNPLDQQALSEAIAAYLSQPEVLSKVVSGVSGAVTISEKDQQLIASRLQAQIKSRTAEEIWASLPKETQDKLGEEAKKVVGQIAAKVGAQLGQQLGDQLSKQLSEKFAGTFATSLATVLQSYMGQALEQFMGALGEALETQLTEGITTMMEGAMTQLMSNMASAFHLDEEAFAAAFQFNMDEKELSELMMSLMGAERTSYDNNLIKLGYADEEKPSEIDIYPINFDSKAEVVNILDAYNERMREEDEGKVITYTDIVGALMSSVTDIVNMISYVLIAFVAISLVVSSIMIGVITYISVLERKKEIGILRSIGASKRDVSRVFNAETVIEGLVSGLMGVGITALACIPANIIVEANFNVHRVARLPIAAAAILVLVSVLLSFVAGLIPSRKAAKADPVEALRSE